MVLFQKVLDDRSLTCESSLCLARASRRTRVVETARERLRGLFPTTRAPERCVGCERHLCIAGRSGRTVFLLRGWFLTHSCVHDGDDDDDAVAVAILRLHRRRERCGGVVFRYTRRGEFGNGLRHASRDA